MRLSRRGVLIAAPAVLAAGASRKARADADTTTDLALSCDRSITPAVAAAGAAWRARTGVRVRLFPTPPNLLIPQLVRNIQNDIIITTVATMDLAQSNKLVNPNGRTTPWRNRLVVASATDPKGPANSFAIPDTTPGSDIDGPAILKALAVPAGPVVGVLDTGAVAWTLAHGGARQGVVRQTELLATPGLRAVTTVPDTAWPPILYVASVSTMAWRGDPAAFVAFLTSADGKAVLAKAGLEAVS